MKEYERLTERIGKSICIKETSANDNKSIWNAIERLAELEDKLENGILIELPCKVGDSFYGVATNAIFKYSVFAIKIVENNAIHLTTIYDIEFVLGKDCFLTKAEAEKKLKELQDG